MAVSLIRTTESHTGSTGSVSQASYTFAVGQAGDAPKGILVFTMQGVSATEAATAVTYGGSSLSKVSGGSAADTATEPGRVTAWFLGSSVPSGAKDCVVTRTNNTTVQYAVAFLLGGANDTWVTGTPVLQKENAAMTAVTIDDGLVSGQTSIVLAGGYSGDNTPAPAGSTGTTTAHTMEGTYDYSFGAGYETTPTYGSRSRGLAASSDDRAEVVLAVTDTQRFIGTGAATLTGKVSGEASGTESFIGTAGGSSAIVTSGLIAEYVGKLATGTGPGINSPLTTQFEDNVSSDYITLSNCAGTDVSGYDGDGTTGDPYNLHLTSPDDVGTLTATGWSFTNGITVELWQSYPAGHAATGEGSGYNSEGSFRLGLRSANTTYATVHNRIGTADDAWGSTAQTGDIQCAHGSWHHVVGTYDPTAQEVKVYANKALDNTLSSVSGALLAGSGKTLNRFGSDTANFGVATLRVYSRALSLTEIEQNYDAGVTAASTDSSSIALTGKVTDAASGTYTPQAISGSGTPQMSGKVSSVAQGAEAFSGTVSASLEGVVEASSSGSLTFTGTGAATLSGVVTSSASGTERFLATGTPSLSGLVTASASGEERFTGSGGGTTAFGKTSLGTATTGTAFSACHFGTRWALPQAGYVTSLSGYVQGGSSNAQTFRLCVYADNGSNAPGALMGYTAMGTVQVSQAAGWVTLNMVKPVYLAPGSYWLDFHYGYPDSASYFYRETFVEGDYTKSVYSENLDDPTDGPADPWAGTSLLVDRTYCIYATYVPTLSGKVSSAAQGSLAFTGTGAATIGTVSSSADGTYTPNAVTGSGSATLTGVVSSAASGAHAVDGTFRGLMMSLFHANAVEVADRAGTADVSLSGAVSSASSGEQTFTGDGGGSLTAGVTGEGSGQVTLAASGAATLTGTVSSSGDGISGNSGAASVALSGTVASAASAAYTPPAVTGEGTPSLSGLVSSSASGTVYAPSSTGTGTPALTSLVSSSAAGEVEILAVTGTGAASLTGAVSAISTGSGRLFRGLMLGLLHAPHVDSQARTGAGDGDLTGTISVEASGEQAFSGSGDVLLSGGVSSGASGIQGVAAIIGSGAVQLTSGVESTGDGHLVITGVAAFVAPKPSPVAEATFTPIPITAAAALVAPKPGLSATATSSSSDVSGTVSFVTPSIALYARQPRSKRVLAMASADVSYASRTGDLADATTATAARTAEKEATETTTTARRSA